MQIEKIASALKEIMPEFTFLVDDRITCFYYPVNNFIISKLTIRPKTYCDKYVFFSIENSSGESSYFPIEKKEFLKENEKIIAEFIKKEIINFIRYTSEKTKLHAEILLKVIESKNLSLEETDCILIMDDIKGRGKSRVEALSCALDELGDCIKNYAVSLAFFDKKIKEHLGEPFFLETYLKPFVLHQKANKEIKELAIRMFMDSSESFSLSEVLRHLGGFGINVLDFSKAIEGTWPGMRYPEAKELLCLQFCAICTSGILRKFPNLKRVSTIEISSLSSYSVNAEENFNFIKQIEFNCLLFTISDQYPNLFKEENIEKLMKYCFDKKILIKLNNPPEWLRNMYEEQRLYSL